MGRPARFGGYRTADKKADGGVAYHEGGGRVNLGPHAYLNIINYERKKQHISDRTMP